jgi:hypothetical protein
MSPSRGDASFAKAEQASDGTELAARRAISGALVCPVAGRVTQRLADCAAFA